MGLTLAASGPAAAHAQLVSSSPGAGDVVPASPAEARLVFSEPIDPAYTSLDVLDGNGKLLATGIGKPDPADARQLVAPLPPLADGAYTISWRAISAADGHSTDGFIAFAVGNATPPPAQNGGGAYPGDVHGGHGVTLAILESLGRSIGILGFMAAAGLAIFGWMLRSAGVAVPSRIPEAQAVGLLAGAAGALLLAYTVVAGASGAVPDVIQYLAGGRNGQLLMLRFGVATIGLLVSLGLILRERPRLSVGLVAGIVGICLNAEAGHAAAFTSMAPLLNQVVHVSAASAWMGGLLGFSVLFLFGTRPLPDMRRVVPRFSAVGLIAVALIALTGAYADWIQTRDPLSLGTQYQVVLAIKIVLFAAAIGVGAINYLRASDEPASIGQAAAKAPRSSTISRLLTRFEFRRRVLAEAALAVGVVAASGLLASGSPPGSLQPVPVELATSSAASQLTADLGLLPGRAGPNQLIVSDLAVPAGDELSLVLQRLDQGGGTASFPLTLGTSGSAVANGVTLPDGSRWDATVVVANPNGTEVARARFVFGIDVDGLTEGEAVPPLDPAVVIALILLVGAVIGLGFGLAGGTLPRTDPRWSRLAIVTGGATAGNPWRCHALPRRLHPMTDDVNDSLEPGADDSAATNPASDPQTEISPRGRRPLLIGIVVVVVLGLGIAIATGLFGGAPSVTNPIPATTDSIARGSSTYAASCAQCHGVDARGGGPQSGTTAVPPPALSGPSGHLTVHSDADLFAFIHNGLPGGMPSWAGTLTDNQIWDVVNFLRSLQGT